MSIATTTTTTTTNTIASKPKAAVLTSFDLLHIPEQDHTRISKAVLSRLKFKRLPCHRKRSWSR